MDLYPCKSGLGLMEPVALINHNVHIMYGSKEEHYRKVVYFEPIPPFQFLDIGALAAQATSVAIRGQNLDVFDNEFAQYRWYTIDHVQVLQWVPQADGKARLRGLMVPFDMAVVDRDPCLHLTEFFIWEDNSPFFTATNYTDYPLTATRLVAMGYRFKLDKKELSPDVVDAIRNWKLPCVDIPCSGQA